MKKETIFLIVQFILFTFFFVDVEIVFGIALPTWFNYLLLAMLGLGFAIIIFGVVNLSDKISNISHPKVKIKRMYRGIYKYVRHPIYLGILFSMFVYAVYTLAPLRVLITLLMGVVLYFKSNVEEKELLRRFDYYRTYRQRTGRFFPKFTNSKTQ